MLMKLGDKKASSKDQDNLEFGIRQVASIRTTRSLRGRKEANKIKDSHETKSGYIEHHMRQFNIDRKIKRSNNNNNKDKVRKYEQDDKLRLYSDLSNKSLNYEESCSEFNSNRNHYRPRRFSNGHKQCRVNLFKLMVIIALVNYEFDLNRELSKQAKGGQYIGAEAKSRGLIYNKDGKFIYRPAKANQGHIIVIDDRQKDNNNNNNEKRNNEQQSSSHLPTGAESLFQPVQLIAGSRAAIIAGPSSHHQLGHFPLRSHSLYPFGFSNLPGALDQATAMNQRDIQQHQQEHQSIPASASQVSASSAIQMIPVIQFVDPLHIATARQQLDPRQQVAVASLSADATRYRNSGIQLYQPSPRLHVQATNPAHSLIAPQPHEAGMPLMKLQQNPYELDPSIGFYLPTDSASLSANSPPHSHLVSNQAALEDHVVTQGMESPASSMSSHLRPPGVRFLSPSPGSYPYHADLARHLTSSTQQQQQQQHYTASNSLYPSSPSSSSPARQFINHYDQSNRLDDFDIYDDHNEPSASRPAQLVLSGGFLNSKLSRNMELNPLLASPSTLSSPSSSSSSALSSPSSSSVSSSSSSSSSQSSSSSSPLQSSPLHRMNQKSSRYFSNSPLADNAVSGLESPTGPESILSERSMRNAKKINYNRPRLVSNNNNNNITGLELRRPSLSINLDGLIDTDRDQGNSRYWNQYRDQFEVIS